MGVYNSLARMYIEQKALAQAEFIINLAELKLTGRPPDPHLLTTKSLIQYLQFGPSGSIQKQLEQSLEILPEQQDARLLLGIIHLRNQLSNSIYSTGIAV